MNEENNIELKSEKVRNIIGQIPPGIIRFGISVLTIIFIGLFVGAYFFEYPQKISVETNWQTIPVSQIYKSGSESNYQYLKNDSIYVEKGEALAILLSSGDTLFSETSGIFYKSSSIRAEISKNNIVFAVIPKKIEAFFPEIYVPDEIKFKLKTDTKILVGENEARIINFFSIPKYNISAKINVANIEFKNKNCKINQVFLFNKAEIILPEKTILNKIIGNLFP